ncbi:hypothetical protein [Kocuria sabuli]|uniref:hypothetical protein n=1 Tax=Kocuria sabuli TaxID=3071448 RepID=UPI0034D3C697
METPLLIGLLGGSAAGAVISALFTILNSRLAWRREVRIFTAQAAVENEKWLRMETVKYIRILSSIDFADKGVVSHFLHATKENVYEAAESLIENQAKATETIAALQMVLPYDPNVLEAFDEHHDKKTEFLKAIRDFDSLGQDKDAINERVLASSKSLRQLEKALSTYLRTNPITQVELN